MIDGQTELTIGIIIFAICGGISIVLSLRVEGPSCFVVLIIGVAIMAPIIYVGYTDRDNEDKAKQLKEKSMLDSMSCKGLGSWLINNSSNSTDSEGGYNDKNYPYAQAKYLVCTHGGLSP